MERILIIIALLTCIILVGYCIYYRNRDEYYTQSKPIYYLVSSESQDPKSLIKNGNSISPGSNLESTPTSASTSASTLASTSSSIVTSPADPTGPAGTTYQTEPISCYLCFNNRCYSEDQLDQDTYLPNSDSKFIPGSEGCSSKCVKCSSIGTPIGMCEHENNTPVMQNDEIMGCICHECDQGKCIYYNMTTTQTRQSGPNCNSNASPPPPPPP